MADNGHPLIEECFGFLSVKVILKCQLANINDVLNLHKLPNKTRDVVNGLIPIDSPSGKIEISPISN
jgi:hypothetical protein